MCGIAGIADFVGRPLDRDALASMQEGMRFRAVDGESTRVMGPTGMVFAPLTIDQGRNQAAQPLSLDGDVWIVADVRLDARDSLKDMLRSAGWLGSPDQTDAALILAGYEIWGEGVVDRVLGDFAFAIWDGRTSTLTAARDHLGVKPLFYCELDGQVLFSNTLSCLLRHPRVGRKLNRAAIADFLLFEGNQDLATTSFAAINRLAPANVKQWTSDRQMSPRRFWEFPIEPARTDAGEDWVGAFRSCLSQAVDDRLPGDRAAILLSGGLDSNAVAGIAAAMHADRGSGPEICCFTSQYEELVPDQEADFARQAAVQAGFGFQVFPMDSHQMFEGWSDLPTSPEPADLVLDSSARALESSIVGHGRVVLTGHGGDPILSPSRDHFGNLVRTGRWLSAVRYLAQGYRSLGRLPPLGLHARWLRRQQRRNWRAGYPVWLAPQFERQVKTLDRWRWYRTASPTEPLHPQRGNAQRGLMDPCWPNYFERLDPGSRQQPLEHRHPLLDIRLVEMAMSLPPSPWCVDKRILREAGRGLMPESVRKRRKTPVSGNPRHRSVKPASVVWQRLRRRVPAVEAFVDPDRVSATLAHHEERGLTGRLDSSARLPINLAYWMQGLGGDLDL